MSGHESEFKRKFRHFRRSVRHQVQYGCALIPIGILMFIPERMALRLGAYLGELAYLVLGRERERAYEQMNRALGDGMSPQEIRLLVKRCFINLGKSFSEVVRMKRIRPEVLLERVQCDSEDVLRKISAEGKGAIIITGHIGNWEYLAGYLGQQGYKLTVLARDNPIPAFDRFITGIRTRYGYYPLNRGTVTSAKESLKVLKRGELLGILIDQDTTVDGVFVDFFGRLAWTPVGAASLALKTGSPILVGSIIRQEDDRHIFHIDGPYRFSASGEKKADQVRITAALTKEIERIIRAHPDHWVWMHRRWKRRPVGENLVEGGSNKL
ncbi:lysophospholipid acyltransferase family protein [bacterium]|nr:lysophospholipid acyltransferase family protein [bacterium]